MSLPKQLQEQRDRADALIKGEAADAQLEVTPPPETTAIVPEIPEEPAPAATATQYASVEPEQQQDYQAALRAVQTELEKSEQRYRTLHGMIRKKDEDLKSMEQLLAQMEAQAAPPPVSDESDIAEFGEDFVRMVERRIDQKFKELDRRVRQTERSTQEAQTEVAQSRQQRFYNELANRVPDWKEIDNSPEFAGWLKKSNTRVDLVRKAMSQFDTEALVELFDQYKAVTGTGQKGPARPSLERKVAPSKGRASAVATAPDQKVWTRSEVAQFYRNARQLPRKEFEATQREIFAAQREGRVQNM